MTEVAHTYQPITRRGARSMKTAVQFGAGNIGRGFMGQLFRESGHRVVFVEAERRLVDLLNAHHSYPLQLLDTYTGEERDLEIDGVSAVWSEDPEAVAGAVAEAAVMGTAVGVRNLEAIAPRLAAGLKRRRAGAGGPVDLYLCENIVNAAQVLEEAVSGHLDGDDRAWVERSVGFVGTVVARMVPPRGERRAGGHPLFVVADSYRKFPYDARALRADPPPIKGMKPVRNFRAEVERKLYSYNLGHAALAYLGYLHGLTYVYECYRHPRTAGLVEQALDETSEALLRRYPRDLDPDEHREVRDDIRVRFASPLIGDTVARVARDPVRKLGRTDRLVGSALLCLEQGVEPAGVAAVCGAALCYDHPEDPDAVRLQEMIADLGVEETLQEVSGIDPESELGRRIVEEYRKARSG